MGSVIIRGTDEENNKVMFALKAQFYKVDKKAVAKSRGETTTIADVYLDECGKEKYTYEEILTSLEACSNKKRDCTKCFFRNEPNCIERLTIEGTVAIFREI